MDDQTDAMTADAAADGPTHGAIRARLRELDEEMQRLHNERERAWMEAEVAYQRRDAMALAVAFRRRREIDKRLIDVRACRAHVYQALFGDIVSLAE